MRLLSVLSIATLLSACSVHAYADVSRGTVFDASFYASAEPRTALDMLQRTPGFTLQEGDARRGYAGSLGNVLVDGRRPVSKSQTLEDALQLIPAGQVARIELLSGADVASDPSGFAVIANVVRVPSTGQGIWSAGAELANQGRPAPNGFFNWSGRSHDVTYNFGGSTYSLVRDLPADLRDIDGNGQALSRGRETSPRVFDEYSLNGSAKAPVLGGTLDVNGKVKYTRYHEDTVRVTTAASGVGGETSITPYTELYRIGEIGAEFNRDIGGWSLKVIGLLNRTHFTSRVASTQMRAGTRFDQAINHHVSESIARASVAHSFGAHHLEFGYERARNSLNATLALTFAQGGTDYPIPVPDSNSDIVEDRDDTYASDQWQIAPNLTSEVRLGFERSDLRFRGDTDKHVVYNFVKPSLSLTRKIGDSQIGLRLYRDVGQINFDDFVSAASLKDAVINGGNPELAPQTQWRTELNADIHITQRTTLNLKAYHSAISETADLVPIHKDGQVYDAPGNIGDGSVDGVSLSLHLPLDRVISGGSLQVDTMTQKTEVTDPLTGKGRRISNLATSSHAVIFRQDMPKHHLAWGVEYRDTSALTKFRFNETDTTQVAPSLTVYVERNNLGPYSLKATLNTDGRGAALRRRVFYRTDRLSAVDRVEDQKQKPGIWLNVALTRLF